MASDNELLDSTPKLNIIKCDGEESETKIKVPPISKDKLSRKMQSEAPKKKSRPLRVNTGIDSGENKEI